MSALNDIQQHDAKMRAKMQRIIGMNDNSYEMLRFELAYRYLENTFGDLENFRKKVVECKIFWAWWCNQYAITEEILVQMIATDADIYSADSRDILKWYKRVHVDITSIPPKAAFDFVKNARKTDAKSSKKRVESK